MSTRIAVLGGGIQGVCIALELASPRIKVDLYDKNERCLTQASSQNEGKIHLGYVFANDTSLRTARLLAMGGLSFAPLLRRWLGSVVDHVPRSAPFYYLVHSGSLINAEVLESYYRTVDDLLLETAVELEGDYFGIDLSERVVRVPVEGPALLGNPRMASAAFRMKEIAVDSEAVAVLLRERLAADPNITVFVNTEVRNVSEADHALVVETRDEAETRSTPYDHVINALWDGKLTINAAMNHRPTRTWLFRYKRFLRLKSSVAVASIPTVTIVLGPFGDVVYYGNDHLHLSWYPAGMQSMTAALQPPKAPELSIEDAAATRRAIVDGLSALFPSISDLPAHEIQSAELKGGYIFSWGSTDIDDISSELHRRYDVGPRTFGNYHTVDTGKYTFAPFFAKQVADRIRSMY